MRNTILIVMVLLGFCGCSDEVENPCAGIDETSGAQSCDPDGPRYCAYGPEDPCEDMSVESGECSCGINSHGDYVWFCMAKGCPVDAQ